MSKVLMIDGFDERHGQVTRVYFQDAVRNVVGEGDASRLDQVDLKTLPVSSRIITVRRCNHDNFRQEYNLN